MPPMPAPGPTRGRQRRRPAEHARRPGTTPPRQIPQGLSRSWTGQIRPALPARHGEGVWRLWRHSSRRAGVHDWAHNRCHRTGLRRRLAGRPGSEAQGITILASAASGWFAPGSGPAEFFVLSLLSCTGVWVGAAVDLGGDAGAVVDDLAGDLSAGPVRAYLAGLAPATRKRKRAAVASICRWAVRHDLLTGVFIEAVRRRLGRASTETTQLYALLDDKVADAEIRAARRRRGRSAS